MTRSNPQVQPSTVQVWRLYRFYDADGVLLYIGQTGRMPLERLIEHLYEQGWAREIARWEVDPRVWPSEVEVLAAEKAAIKAEKPRYNWEHNEGPHRVWVPKVGHYRHPGRRGPVPGRALSPAWRHRWTWAAGLAVCWLGLAALLWWAAAVLGVDVPGRTYPIAAAGAVVLVPMLRRCKRRERRFVVAVVTVACTALWLITG